MDYVCCSGNWWGASEGAGEHDLSGQGGRREEPAHAAIEEMLKQEPEGRTAFAAAVVADAPVELLESMVELDKQDTKKRPMVSVCDRAGRSTLQLVDMHRTDASTIKLLVREYPGAMYYGLKYALEYNKKSTAVVSLLRKCAALENGNISALIDLCGESDVLLLNKVYVEKHPVHHAAGQASGIAILKPVIRENASELLIKDKCEDEQLEIFSHVLDYSIMPESSI